MDTVMVTGGSRSDVAAMAVLALNLKETNGQYFDGLVIFHDGIREKDQKLLNQIFPTRFIWYQCPVSRFKLYQNRSIRYFSPMVLCKLECFHLLEEYDTVVWSDYDVIIKDSIEEILQSECGWRIVRNDTAALKDMFFPSIQKRNVTEYDMDGPCICAPLFMMNRKMGHYKEYYDWCCECARQYIKDLYLPEQCVLTMLVQKFKIPYENIDLNIYAVHPKEDRSDVKIIHAYGQPKFWNGLYNEKWEEYYAHWISLGGTKVPGKERKK